MKLNIVCIILCLGIAGWILPVEDILARKRGRRYRNYSPVHSRIGRAYLESRRKAAYDADVKRKIKLRRFIKYQRAKIARARGRLNAQMRKRELYSKRLQAYRIMVTKPCN